MSSDSKTRRRWSDEAARQIAIARVYGPTIECDADGNWRRRALPILSLDEHTRRVAEELSKMASAGEW